MKKIWIAVLLVLLSIIVFFSLLAHTTPHYKNCTDALEHGAFNIPKLSKAYEPKLDHNKNGVACERK